MSNIYPASYLKFKADQYQPPSLEELIRSYLGSIMLSLHGAAQEGQYQMKLGLYDKRRIFHSKEILLGVLTQLTRLGYRVDVNSLPTRTDPYPEIVVSFNNDDEGDSNRKAEALVLSTASQYFTLSP